MIKKSEKILQWSIKHYVANVLVYLFNAILIAGIFLFTLFLNNMANESAMGIMDFFSSRLKPTLFASMLIVFASVMFIFFYSYDRNKMRNAKNSQMLFLCIEICLIVDYVFTHYINFYLRPVTLYALLVTFLMNKKFSCFNSAFFCIFLFVIDIFSGSQITITNYIYLVVSISASIVAVLCVANVYSRIKLLLRSLYISIYPLLGVLISLLAEGTTLEFKQIIKDLACAFCSGLLAVAIFMVILPFFEVIFGKVTRFKLSELTDHKSKLIQRLINEAPGTFNHSILVSNIAESCATAIGEDALLARTCAYYHDIGKLRRPEYFAENNVGGKNPHEGLTPELSTNIIKSHTIDGYNLLIKHNFPKEIANICIEHHGTMPIYFFYAKAKQFTDGEVNISNYCYAESKPQTKIASIIMLADSCEAASRTLTDRSRENVKKTVDKIVKDRVEMGQFDECDITLKELGIIKNAIVNNITGIYHNRIEYPKVFINEEQKTEVKEITDTQKDKANE